MLALGDVGYLYCLHYQLSDKIKMEHIWLPSSLQSQPKVKILQQYSDIALLVLSGSYLMLLGINQ